MRKGTWSLILFAVMLTLMYSLMISASAESTVSEKEPDIWADLEPIREELPDGSIQLSLTLTEEQAEQMSRADLRILQQFYTENGGVENAYVQIWHTPALELNENRTLSVVFPGDAVYAVDDLTGEVLAGPVDCVRMQNGRVFTTVLYSNNEGIGPFGEEPLQTRLYFEMPDELGTLKVESVEDLGADRQITEPMEEYLTGTDYTRTVFWHLDIVPTEEDSEVLALPGWQWDSGYYWGETPQLTGWHLERRKMEAGFDRLRAVFRMVDLQDNNHCTEAIRMFPEMVKEYTGILSAAGTEESLADGTVKLEHFLEEDCVCVTLDLGSLPDGIESLRADRFTVNDTTVLRELNTYSDNGVITFSLNDRKTAGISELNRMGFDLELRNGTYGEERTAYISIELPEPVLLDREGAAPLAEMTSADGLVWRLWGIQQISDSRFRVHYDVTNPAGKAKRISHKAAVIGALYGSTFGSVDIALGQTVVGELILDTEVWAYNGDNETLARNDKILAWLGDSEFSDLKLFYQDEESSYLDKTGYQAVFHWEEPVAYKPSEAAVPETNTILLSQQDQEIRLSEFLVERNPEQETYSAVLGLWLENRSEKDVVIQFDSLFLDGVRISNRTSTTSTWKAPDPIRVPAGTVRYTYFVISLPEGTDTVSRIEFDCFADEIFIGTITAESV